MATISLSKGYKHPVLRAYMYGDPQDAVDRKRREDEHKERMRLNKHRRIAWLTRKALNHETH